VFNSLAPLSIGFLTEFKPDFFSELSSSCVDKVYETSSMLTCGSV
jgi:hypothetical protein